MHKVIATNDTVVALHDLAEREFDKYRHSEILEDRRFHWCRFDFFMSAYEKERDKCRKK